MSRLVALLTAIVATCVVTVSADCYDPSPASLLGDARIVAMFSGTLRTVQKVRTGNVIAFDVDAVWKGTVPRSAVVYNYIEFLVCGSSVNRNTVAIPGVMPPRMCGGTTGEGSTHALIPGGRYFVATHSLTAFEREQFALDRDAPFLGWRGCNGSDFYDSLERNGLLLPLGPSREAQ